MGIDEKAFVREVVRVHLQESAPGRLPDLEADFEPLFAAAQEREKILREPGSSQGQGLPFDASFGVGVFVGTILWVALKMVREVLAAGSPRDLERRLELAEWRSARRPVGSRW